MNWLKVTVDPRSREVFSYQAQIVPANRRPYRALTCRRQGGVQRPRPDGREIDLTFDSIKNPDLGGRIDLLIDGRTVDGEKVNMSVSSTQTDLDGAGPTNTFVQ